MPLFSEAIPPEFRLYLTEVLGWSEAVFEAAQKSWREARQELLAPLSGKWIGLNTKGQLTLVNYPDETVLETLRVTADTGRVGAREILYFDSNSGQPSGKYQLPTDTLPGILFSEQGTYLFAEALKDSPFLPEVVEFIDWSAQDLRRDHLDIFPVAAHRLAFVSLRETGEVLAISLATEDIVGRWKLRQIPSVKAFNFTVDAAGDTLYITDSTSAQLHMIALPDLTHRTYKSGLGILGSIAAAPTPGKLYITILQPEFNVIYFDMENTRAEYSLDIRGESWTATEQFPQDSFHELVGGNYIYLSRHNGHPLLHLIDGEEIQVKKRVSLSEPLPPAILARPTPNPYPQALAYDFETHLTTTQSLSPQQMAGYTEWLAQREADRLAAEAAARETELKKQQEEADKILKVPRKQPKVQANFRVHQPPKQDETLWRLVDKPASEMALPEGTAHAIVDLIIWAFYRMTLTNLRVHGKELKRIEKIAQEIKKELNTKQVVLAKIENILGKHRFETPIDRNSVFKVIAQRKQTGTFYRLEDLCPLCQTPFESQVCPECHFQLSLPEHDELAGKAYSAEAADFLFPGQLLIPLEASKGILCMNIWRQPVQHIQEKGHLLKSISDALLLPNHHFLVVDHDGGKLVELSPAGEIVWKARLALKKPTRATFYEHPEEGLRYIVLDQGNLRILELDASGRHHRRYPTTRTPDPLKLKHPTDIQQVPSGEWIIADPGAQRVLRIGTQGECLADISEGLIYPLAARENYAGHLEIIDTGQKAWLLLDKHNNEIGRFVFWPPPLVDEGEWEHQDPPHWVSRLHNGEWLLMGKTYFMQMAPEEGLVRWIAPLPSPDTEDSLLKVKFHTKSPAELQEEKVARHAEALGKIYGIDQAPEAKRQHLARYVKHLSFKQDQVVLAPATTGHVMYMILSGTLACLAPEPDKPVIFEVGEGEMAAVSSVMDTEKKTYKPGWIAREDTEVLMLERGDFKRAVMGFAGLFQLAKQIHNDHQRRIRQFQERKTEALQDHLRSRIAEGLIKDFALFKQADKAFFEALSDVLQANAYMPDHAIFHRNESSGPMYFIFEGTVGILRKGEVTPEITLGEGQFFGEMSALTQAPRSTTVVTLDYCKMFALQSWQAQRLFKGYPWFKEALEQEAEKRTQANALSVKRFSRAAGIDREDLPLIQVQPQNFFPEEPPRYMCSLHHDVIFGFNTQGEVLWHWGQTPEEQLFQPHQVKIIGEHALVVDTGNDRVLEISLKNRQIVRKWDKGLKQPVSADLTPEGFLLVANAESKELRVSDNFGRTLWDYKAPREIEAPCYVQITPQGTILFTDKALHGVYELQRNGDQIWSHGSYKNPGDSELQLNAPAFALRLEDGSTLIGDAGNQRLVRVLQDEEVIITPLPVLDSPLDFEHVEMLPQGDLILYSFSQDRILRLGGGGSGPAQKIIWQAVHQFPLRAKDKTPTLEIKAPHWILDLETLQAEDAQNESTELSERTNPAEVIDEAANAAMAEQLSEGHWANPEDQALFSDGTSPPIEPAAALDEEQSKALEDLEKALDITNESANFEGAKEDAQWQDLAFLEDKPVTQTQAKSETEPSSTPPWGDLSFLKETPDEDFDKTLVIQKSASEASEPVVNDTSEAANPWGDLAFLDEEANTAPEPEQKEPLAPPEASSEEEPLAPPEASSEEEPLAPPEASSEEASSEPPKKAIVAEAPPQLSPESNPWGDLAFLDEEANTAPEPEQKEPSAPPKEAIAAEENPQPSPASNPWEDLAFLDEAP